MKLTTKTMYGLLAVLDLAQNFDKAPIKLKDITERQNIPDAYLVNILQILKSAGIVSSYCGPGGGYFLNRLPKMIRLSEIVAVLGGQFDLPNCPVNANNRDKSSEYMTKTIWMKLKKLEEDFLDSITLDDIVNRRI